MEKGMQTVTLDQIELQIVKRNGEIQSIFSSLRKILEDKSAEVETLTKENADLKQKLAGTPAVPV